MTHQHTPGPWTIAVSDGPRKTSATDQGYCGDCGQYQRTRPHVATLTMNGHVHGIIAAPSDTHAEVSANANLIAAAPDLLEALDALTQAAGLTLEDISEETTGHFYDLRHAHAKARDVIERLTSQEGDT